MTNTEFEDKVNDRKAKKFEVLEALKELKSLSQCESVKRYLELKEYETEANKKLVLMSDQEIEDSVKEYEGNEYVCLGKRFIGYERPDGNYVILSHNYDRFELLSIYKNNNTNEEIIIKYDEAEDFEKNHKVVEEEKIERVYRR